MHRLMFLVASTMVSASIFAQDDPTAGGSAAATNTSAGTKYAIILCGLTGDGDHHKLFADTVVKLHEGLSSQLGFSADNIQILFGDEPQESDADLIKSATRSKRVEFEKSVAELRKGLRPEDTVWVIVVGHSHYDGENVWLNLPGPDIHQTDFARLFDGMTSAQQVFVITTPVSGFFIKPMSAKGRVVISATLADWETNETEFPHVLARVLTTPPQAKDLDIDQDGMISLFDLYVTVARNLAQNYLDQQFLVTEHPSLDDNGDGQGTEAQVDFLTEEQGGRPRPRKRTAPPALMTADGWTAKSIILTFARPAPPTPPVDSDPSSAK